MDQVSSNGFRVGDIICQKRGTKSPYAITSGKWIGQVIYVHGDVLSCVTIPIPYDFDLGTVWSLKDKYFEVAYQ